MFGSFSGPNNVAQVTLPKNAEEISSNLWLFSQNLCNNKNSEY